MTTNNLAEILDGEFFAGGRASASDSKEPRLSVETSHLFDMIADANTHRIDTQRSPAANLVRHIQSSLSALPIIVLTHGVQGESTRVQASKITEFFRLDEEVRL